MWLPDGTTVIDVLFGCGSGVGSEVILERSHKVVDGPRYIAVMKHNDLSVAVSERRE